MAAWLFARLALDRCRPSTTRTGRRFRVRGHRVKADARQGPHPCGRCSLTLRPDGGTRRRRRREDGRAVSIASVGARLRCWATSVCQPGSTPRGTKARRGDGQRACCASRHPLHMVMLLRRAMPVFDPRARISACEKVQWQPALALLCEMVGVRLEPINLTCYSTLISACEKKGQGQRQPAPAPLRLEPGLWQKFPARTNVPSNPPSTPDLPSRRHGWTRSNA